MRFWSNTHSGRSLPARHCATLRSDCSLSSRRAYRPAAPRRRRRAERDVGDLAPVCCSIATVMIWSSCLRRCPPSSCAWRALPCAISRHRCTPWSICRVFRIHPQHELIERHHLHRRQIAPVEGGVARERRGKQVGQGDDDLVRVAVCALDVEEALAPALPGLLITTIDCFIKWCLTMMPCMIRAI